MCARRRWVSAQQVVRAIVHFIRQRRRRARVVHSPGEANMHPP